MFRIHPTARARLAAGFACAGFNLWPVVSVAADDATQLNAVEVAADRNSASSYGADRSRSATKTDTPLLETPQSVQVITGELIRDQAAIKLDEALRNVAGVMPGGYYGSYDYYRIRGFDSSGYTLLDGLSMSKGTVTLNKELFGLQQLEVLKGPSSTLYGAASPGGLVNLVSKRPQRENFVDAGFTAGSEDYWQPSLDANAVLTQDRSLYGRLNLLWRDADSFVDYTHSNRLYAAPALSWDIDKDTQLTLLTSYQSDDARLGFPLPAAGTVLPNPNGTIPRERYVGEPAQANHIREWLASAGYVLSHRINATWTLNQTLRNSWDRSHWSDVLYPIGLSDDLSTEYRIPYYRASRTGTLGVDSNALADFTVGPVRNRLLLGVDYYYQKDAGAGAYGSTSVAGAPLNLFDPQYGIRLSAPDSLGELYVQNVRQLGFYAQHQADLTPTLHMTAGLRADRAGIESGGVGQNDRKVTPRLGASWEFVDGLAVYGNYGRSFLPQSGTQADGQTAKPETGTSWEAGLKGERRDRRLRFTAALYQLTRDNVITADPFNPAYVVLGGRQRSRGAELDGSAQPLPGWDLTLAYAYTQTEVLNDTNADAIGKPLLNVPRHSASLWSKYTLRSGALRGLGAGVGGSAYSRQAACSPGADCALPEGYGSSFDLPAYALLNAALYYQRGPLSAQLNASNLLDRTYYAGSYNALYVLPGTPRSVLASLSYHW